MSDDSDYNYSEDEAEIDDEKHAKLVDNVLGLSKVQQVKKASRSEPISQISEFNLVKSVTGNKGYVHLNELAKTLKARKKHAKIGEKLSSTSKKAKTLPKPLEKPQADRVARTVNYERTRLDFDRWEAFITSNRAAVHQVFPLDSVEKVKFEQKQAEAYSSKWRLKSDLQMELENLQPKVESYNINLEEEEQYPLTLKELKEKRKEAAKLRAHKSFKEAKARQQNKIKSKKYHRILKREKVKRILKEFEELQKVNPEEALKKLEEIEKARAEERFSLRHKGTGQWAKNKQIRAKYDKESRQVLAQQLSISRDLTQKIKVTDSDSENEYAQLNEDSETFDKNPSKNPWTNMNPDKEVLDFVSGYKKYWNEQNKIVHKDAISDNETDKNPEFQNSEGDDAQNVETQDGGKQSSEKKSTGKKQRVKNAKSKITKSDQEQLTTSGVWDTSIIGVPESESLKSKQKKSKKLSDVDIMFESAESKMKNKMNKKLKVLTKTIEKKIKKKTPKKQSPKNKTADLSFKSQSKKHVIDEEMNETSQQNGQESRSENLTALKNILQNSDEASNNNNVKSQDSNNIDPNKFMQKISTNLNTAVPDLLTNGEIDEVGNDQRELIIEAFEDDDIVQDFSKEKSEEIQKDKPQDIDLNLPGWGSWAGAKIKSTRKRRRFIIKMPKSIPRRDDNKGSLIINEKAQAKIKDHLVSSIPFPFKTIKDFEASIRAPIGNTFVPENAFRKLIRPAVQTKVGSIIEPVSKDILVGKKKV